MERFWNKVNKTDTCWLWTAGKQKEGYGKFWFNGKTQTAHILSYELHKGPIPKGKQINHTHSHNKHCVNPDHLYAGTQEENMQDRLRDGKNPNKNKTHCKHGHEYNAESTYYHPNNQRVCKQCKKMHDANWKAKRGF